jgi:hypothetical protein
VSTKVSKFGLAVSTEVPKYRLALSTEVPKCGLAVSTEVPKYRLALSTQVPKCRLAVSTQVPKFRLCFVMVHLDKVAFVSWHFRNCDTSVGVATDCDRHSKNFLFSTMSRSALRPRYRCPFAGE